MKRREFLGYTGLGALGAATSTVLSGCSEDEPAVKFWQQGNFRPVSEEVTETSLKVEGSIPPSSMAFMFVMAPTHLQASAITSLVVMA